MGNGNEQNLPNPSPNILNLYSKWNVLATWKWWEWQCLLIPGILQFYILFPFFIHSSLDTSSTFPLLLLLQSCHCHKDYPLGTYSVLSGYCLKKQVLIWRMLYSLCQTKPTGRKEFWRVDRSQCWESWQGCILRLLFSNSKSAAEIAAYQAVHFYVLSQQSANEPSVATDTLTTSFVEVFCFPSCETILCPSCLDLRQIVFCLYLIFRKQEVKPVLWSLLSSYSPGH